MSDVNSKSTGGFHGRRIGIDRNNFKIFPRSQAPAWERICARSPGFGRLPSREAGEPPRQVRSQAGAWEREGLGTRKSPCLGTHLRPKPRLRASPVTGSRGTSPASAFPSWGLGTRRLGNEKREGLGTRKDFRNRRNCRDKMIDLLPLFLL